MCNEFNVERMPQTGIEFEYKLNKTLWTLTIYGCS